MAPLMKTPRMCLTGTEDEDSFMATYVANDFNNVTRYHEHKI